MTNPFTSILSIEQSILFTLKFFEIMERPLDINDLYRFLWRNETSIENLYEEVEKLILEKKISSEEIILSDSEKIYYATDKKIFGLYKKRENLRNRLIKKAKFASDIIKYIPFIDRIYLCNSLSFGSSKKGSDIDFFIVTKKNRMFFARTFITIILSILKLRRHDNKVADHICLSFFTEKSNLNLKKIAILNDVYLVYWIANLKIMHSSFLAQTVIENNRWIFHYLPNLNDQDSKWVVPKIRFYPSFIMFLEVILDITFISSVIQKISKIYQLRRAKRKLKKLSDKAKNIVSENMLKFHDKDRREEYRNKWLSAIYSNAKLKIKN